MKFINIIIAAAFVFVLASCNEKEVFEKEQYKNVFALISENENILSKFFYLEEEESMGYISFSMGGSNDTDRDLVINLVEDASYIDEYNRTNFDVEYSKYTNAMPVSKYDIESYTCTIKAGDIKGELPVRIRPGGLSPDSTYFIPVKVESYSAYEVNPEKSYLLYQVRIKNKWAVGDGNTNYTLRGKIKEDGGAETGIPGTKIMHPISGNQVRIMAGNETYASDVATFNKSAIILEIDKDNKVTIKPYKNISVTQLSGDEEFNNTFKIENDGVQSYKTFLLHYRFTSSDGKIYEMKEELRLQFNEKEEEESLNNQ